jgi:hypothetical protein
MSQRFCGGCGSQLPDNAHFCNTCGKPVTVAAPPPPTLPPSPQPYAQPPPAYQPSAAYQPPLQAYSPGQPTVQAYPSQSAVTPGRVKSGRRSFGQWLRWLGSRDGLPVLISILAGVIIGLFINGALGLILATAAGFFVLKLFNRLPIRLSPWQALVVDISPVVAKLLFYMVFLLPVASYLTLPSGHTPNTLTKYASIIFLIPKNLFQKPGSDVFPGFVFIVIIAIVLMMWGVGNLGKMKNWLLALAGLLLYTLSPSITSTLMGAPDVRIIMSFFSIGYYCAWLGLILAMFSRYMPGFFRLNPRVMKRIPGMMSLLPPVVAFALFSQWNAMQGSWHLPLLQVLDFESDHHFIAGVFSGGIAGWGAATAVGEAGPSPEDSPDEGQAEEPEPEETPPEEPPLPQGPQPFSGPDVPEGSTIEYNPDGSKTIRCPDGYTATKYPDGTQIHHMPDGTIATIYNDGTIYGEHPDGSKTTEYPDGTTKYWGPDGTTQTEYPNGGFETSSPDGYKASFTKNDDGTMDLTSGDGDKLHFPKEGPPVGSMTAKDGTKYTFNGDGTASVTSPYGGTMTLDKDGNFSGSFTDKDGNKITIQSDGSFEAETAEGDKISVNADGIKATLKDGNFIQTDAEGNPVKAHLTGPEGTLDINTDDKGTHIKGQDKEGTFEVNTDPQGNTHMNDDRGNTADIKPDGSGKVAGPDGNGSWDADGNGEFTTPEGVKWKANSDGSGSVEDAKGNKADFGKDGSLAVTNNGKTTTYTPEQAKEMQAKAGGIEARGKAGPIDTAGGN